MTAPENKNWYPFCSSISLVFDKAVSLSLGLSAENTLIINFWPVS